MQKKLRKAGIAGALALCLLAAACGGGGKKAAASSDSTCPNGKITFGIEPYEAPSQLTPAYQALSKAISTGMNCPVKLDIVQDYAGEIVAMKAGKLDIAEFGPLGFVFAFDFARAAPIASFATANGKLSTYTAGIWVPKASSIQSLTDLKGKTLALSSVGSTSGDALPRYALLQAGVKPTQLKEEYAGGHPESLLALTKGKVAAGEINSQEMESAVAAKEINPADYREIWTSAPIPNDPVTVFGGETPAFKAKLTQVLLNLPPATLDQISKFLEFDPPGPMLAVSKATYQQLFDLADKLNLTEKDL